MAKKRASRGPRSRKPQGAEAPTESTELIVCPIPHDPEAGDKTPAVVEWWHKHHPDIAKEKYKNRVTHLTDAAE